MSTETLIPDDAELRALLAAAKTVAVVGLSSKPGRDSNSTARYLQRAGYRIVPVNPNESEVLGERAYKSLLDVPDPVDIVDVFRRAPFTPPVARDAVRAGARVLWLQEGIFNDEARRIGDEGGVTVVMGVCLHLTIERLRGG